MEAATVIPIGVPITGCSVQMKLCPRCKSVKPLSEWTIRKSGKRKGQPVAHCKSCNVDLLKERKKRDPTIYERCERPSKLKRLYGITMEDYYRMLAEQLGGCAICGSVSAKHRKYVRAKVVAFSVDHCHKTGKVRGLLCNHCNRAVGLIDDNPATALRMAAYLNR